jgi:hypothetical protein
MPRVEALAAATMRVPFNAMKDLAQLRACPQHSGD